jgi:hypothetical protein
MKILEAVKKAGGKNVMVTAAYKAFAQGDPHYRNQPWVQKYAFIIETGIRRSPDYMDPTESAYMSAADSAEILRAAKERMPDGWTKNPDGSVTQHKDANGDSKTWKQGHLISVNGVPYTGK